MGDVTPPAGFLEIFVGDLCISPFVVGSCNAWQGWLKSEESVRSMVTELNNTAWLVIKYGQFLTISIKVCRYSSV
jgi:hypothetical protein